MVQKRRSQVVAHCHETAEQISDRKVAAVLSVSADVSRDMEDFFNNKSGPNAAYWQARLVSGKANLDRLMSDLTAAELETVMRRLTAQITKVA